MARYCKCGSTSSPSENWTTSHPSGGIVCSNCCPYINGEGIIRANVRKNNLVPDEVFSDQRNSPISNEFFADQRNKNVVMLFAGFLFIYMFIVVMLCSGRS